MDGDSTWTLWCQDDNGSSAVIARHLVKGEAESRRADLEARGHKQHYWIEPENADSPLALNLVVIRSRDMEASKSFYELIGLQFALHQHGRGAEHYACESPSCVFEIYPEVDQSSSGARVGFSIASVDRVIEEIRAGCHDILSEPCDSPWGRRAVVRDPDGHSVELVTPTARERVSSPSIQS